MTDLVILFFKALGIGLAVAAPVGPVGIFCIRRAISVGRMQATVAGFGAAIADSLYASIAAFGLTSMSDYLITYQTEGRLVGGIFLLYLAYKFFHTRSETNEDEIKSGKTLVAGFIIVLLMTITNPATIASFAAIFFGIGFMKDMTGGLDAIVLIAGVLLGSALWWVVLAYGAVALKARVGDRMIPWANLGAAVLIGIFGIMALVSVIV